MTFITRHLVILPRVDFQKKTSSGFLMNIYPCIYQDKIDKQETLFESPTVRLE